MKRTAIASIACLWASLAFGQANNSNTWATPGNQTVGGQVQMGVNASGLAVPLSAPGSGNSGYPPGSTPMVATNSGADTTTLTASITPGPAQFAYVCSIEVNGLGATAATSVTPTLGLFGGVSLSYQGQYTFPTGAAVAATPFTRTYSPCLQRTSLGFPLTLTVPGAAGNTTTNLIMTGYVQ